TRRLRPRTQPLVLGCRRSQVTGANYVPGRRVCAFCIQRVLSAQKTCHFKGTPREPKPSWLAWRRTSNPIRFDPTASREYQPTLGSFLDLFARLRRERIIPA